MKTMEADVIVVAAALQALRQQSQQARTNLKAIVFEKSNTTGGVSKHGYGYRLVSVQNTRKKHSAISQ